MPTNKSVQTCLWSTPTLFLPWPHWFLASQHEWSCVRKTPVTVLSDPSICRGCACWMAALAPPARAREAAQG
jgi:hypothetical protein